MIRISKTYRAQSKCVLYPGDCKKLLESIPDNAVDLVFTSPPYCMGKEYESTRNVDDFVTLHQEVLPEILRVTKTGGSICWQVGYHVTEAAITPLDFLIHQNMAACEEVILRNRIIWTYGFGLNSVNRFSGRHEVVLWYTKGADEYTFNLDQVRVPQKYQGKCHYKGPKKGEPSCNPLGKNPSDVWDIPNVKANHVEKTKHPCQFPVALARRIILALTPEDGLVLDPYAGSGTTGAAAILEERRFAGAEILPKYYRIAKKRLFEASAGKLVYREDKPVQEPNPRMKVARRPQSS